jgi:hypothetical protein
MHASLLDPGGVLNARQSASRTAAFRPLETVGFLLRTPLRAILLSTTLLISGLHHAACILAPSSFVPPLLGVHVEFTTDRLAKLWSGGTCTVPGSHPLGNNSQFHGFSPNPKVSGFPWRDQRVVRCSPMTVPRLWLPPLPDTHRCASAVTGNGRNKHCTVLREGTPQSGYHRIARCLS